MHSEYVALVRRFNRLVTQRVGALNDQFLGRDRPLGESRVLFEIGEKGSTLRDLRARLGLDSGYLSRLMQSLVSARLVTLRPDPGDERVRRAFLTRAGHTEVEEINQRSDEAAAAMLDHLTDTQQDRLVAAMVDVHALLLAAGTTISRVDPASDVARWCIARYFAELRDRFRGGFAPEHSLPAEDAELRPPSGSFLVAMADGEPVACGVVKAVGARAGSIKRMWVADSMRGLGLGRRMLLGLESEARALGLTTVRLETNKALGEALHLYRSAGYDEVAPFNDEAYADYWFEKRLR